MPKRFRKHYTREEARALLPQLRQWLADLNRLRDECEHFEKRLGGMALEGQDTGGETVNNWIRALTDMQSVLRELQSREIFLKDITRGLVDFPAIIGGREVFLCWEADEDDIEHWHDIDSGYSGREKLE